VNYFKITAKIKKIGESVRNKKKKITMIIFFLVSDLCSMRGFYLPSSDTVSFFLPVALLFDNTFLPFLVDILSLKPCLFLRFLTDG
jgi:hypothetical protein